MENEKQKFEEERIKYNNNIEEYKNKYNKDIENYINKLKEESKKNESLEEKILKLENDDDYFQAINYSDTYSGLKLQFKIIEKIDGNQTVTTFDDKIKENEKKK